MVYLFETRYRYAKSNVSLKIIITKQMLELILFTATFGWDTLYLNNLAFLVIKIK